GLLLDAVRGHRPDLGQHVLAGIEQSAARAKYGLAVLCGVPGNAAARLKLRSLIWNGAIERETGIAEECGECRGLRVDRLGHDLRVPAQPVIEGDAVADGPLVLRKQRILFVRDV